MNNPRTRHYRVVKKEVEKDPQNGVFIPKNKKNTVFILLIVFMLVAFIKGLLFGIILEKNKK